jgi:hypothetical protein
LHLALTYEHSGVVGTWAPTSYDVSRLRAGGGITNRAVKANGLGGLCPLLQRCDAWTFLRHLQLLLLLRDPGKGESLEIQKLIADAAQLM